MRFLRLFVVGSIIVAALLAANVADAKSEAQALRHKCFREVNLSRRHHGLTPVRLKWDLASKAWHHSRRMARRYSVYHTTDLARIVRPYGAHTWGENVGMSGTCDQIQRAFMRSPVHRANILASRFRHIGIGVVRSAGRIWVTYDFYG